MGDLDMDNRDPNGLNGQIQVQFEDVLGETEGAHSISCVWKLSYTCYTLCKGLAYKIITLFTGCYIAMAWGITFALIAFCHIWCCTPTFKVLALNCALMRRCNAMCFDCCFGPMCETFALLFSRIGVTNSSG